MTYTHVFCAREKGCRICVTHVHACSDCVHTRDDADRLNYASRFVHVIYSSHIVSIKLDAVTKNRRKKKNKKNILKGKNKGEKKGKNKGEKKGQKRGKGVNKGN